MNQIEFKATVTKGELHIVHRARMMEDVKLLEDGTYDLILKKRRKTVSNPLRRYYFGVIVKLVQQGLKDAGTRLKLNETDEWIRDLLSTLNVNQTHEYLKMMFMESIKVDEDGVIIRAEQSTKKMTNVEFMEYYNPVYQWAAEFLNIQIPLPNETFDVPPEFQDHEPEDNKETGLQK